MALLNALRWDITIQARNGFYWASAFVVVMLGALFTSLPASIEDQAAAWVPAILVINLQITTFFFVAGLLLLERDEGALLALAITPFAPGQYLAMRTISLTVLAVAETVAIIWIGFGARGSWAHILLGTAALGVVYTGFGAAVATRYDSVNALLLPASVFVTFLLLPLLAHFELAPRALFWLHPTEPPLTLMRAGYAPAGSVTLLYGAVGSLAWGLIAFVWGRHCVERLMRDTSASGH